MIPLIRIWRLGKSIETESRLVVAKRLAGHEREMVVTVKVLYFEKMTESGRRSL